jgi:hypothetical protein
MGREIRKVPPNWKHPEVEHNGRMRDQPMHDQRYEDAEREWLESCRKWYAGEDPDREEYKKADGSYSSYWEWDGGPPDREYYRPWKNEEATWFQVWETVSEGTPVTPPFATREELVSYLVANGDFWDQRRRAERPSEPGNGPWSPAQAEAFVNSGWAPSGLIVGGVVHDSRDAALIFKEGVAMTPDPARIAECGAIPLGGDGSAICNKPALHRGPHEGKGHVFYRVIPGSSPRSSWKNRKHFAWNSGR